MSEKQVKITIVNQKENNQTTNENQQTKEQDPLIQELRQMKITSNLIKEINFNSAVNKFQYLEQLLSQEYANFDKKVTELTTRQKQMVVSKIKNMHKNIQKIENQLLKQKESQNSLLGNKSVLLELHKKAESVIQTKKSSEKFLKLSEGINKSKQGMLNAVCKIERELDDHVKTKIESMNQNIEK